MSDQLVVGGVRLVDCLVYVGPHVIAGEGLQAVFDFGFTQATVFCGPDSRGLELMAFGEREVQLFGLDAAKAVELLMAMVDPHPALSLEWRGRS